MDKTGSETQQIVLVDIYDRPAGYMEKMEAHEKGLLHRAVSVFLFNQHGEWMLQRLTEYEYDHIYIGHTSNLPQINPQEVAEWGYFTPGMLAGDLQAYPVSYTAWFWKLFPEILERQFSFAWIASN